MTLPSSHTEKGQPPLKSGPIRLLVLMAGTIPMILSHLLGEDLRPGIFHQPTVFLGH